MEVKLEIKDGKAAFFLELINNLNFVKIKEVSKAKTNFLKEFKNAIEDVNLARQGKIKLKSAEELLNEL